MNVDFLKNTSFSISFWRDTTPQPTQSTPTPVSSEELLPEYSILDFNLVEISGLPLEDTVSSLSFLVSDNINLDCFKLLNTPGPTEPVPKPTIFENPQADIGKIILKINISNTVIALKGCNSFSTASFISGFNIHKDQASILSSKQKMSALDGMVLHQVSLNYSGLKIIQITL